MNNVNLDILGFGIANVDVIVNFNQDNLAMQKLIPHKGHYSRLNDNDFRDVLRCTPMNVSSGGSVANTMKSLSVMGNKTGFVGSVGNDTFGNIFSSDLETSGVVSKLITQENLPTGCCVIMVHDDGERTMTSKDGAAINLGPQNIKDEDIKNSNFVMVEGYMIATNFELIESVQKAAKQHNKKFILTLAGINNNKTIQNRFIHLLQNSDILFGNDTEFSFLNSRTLPSLSIRTMGADGCKIYNGGKWQKYASAKCKKVINTNGAGDAFAAGFLHGIINGKSTSDSVGFGNNISTKVLNSEVSFLTR